jgi:ACS family hexuronate transporter-like MFS transporter
MLVGNDGEAAGRRREPPRDGVEPVIDGRRRPIRGLRWYIASLLFASTVVNYIDRQTLNVLAPYLKTEFRWTNSDFALVIIAFRIAYAVGQAASGRLLDRLGTRRGLSLGVAWYSCAAMLTSLASGLWSFCTFRFLLGLGESANWPGATKAVSQWFPRRESGWAVALFDSGSSVGGLIAPWLVLALHRTFGTWRPAFVITGVLGWIWLAVFRRVYDVPERHPRLSDEERALILADRAQMRHDDAAAGYRRVAGYRQTWGIVVAKALTDPVWFFVTDWFAVYLVALGFRLEDSLVAFWVPFLAADAGNFIGGGVSSAMIRRGWSVGAARRAVIGAGAVGMSGLALSLLAANRWWLTLCFAISTLSYAALSTMVLNLPADVYPDSAVATVSGLSGAGAGIGTIAATFVTGIVADRYSFGPILIAASTVPLVAAAVTFACVRNTPAMERGELRWI